MPCLFNRVAQQISVGENRWAAIPYNNSV